MKKIAVFFAEGYEEVEALAVVDICRRAGITVDMVSVMDDLVVRGGHGIDIKMDKRYAEADWDAYDILVLPGGLMGTKHLEAHGELMGRIDDFYQRRKYIAAICAAPSIFGHRGLLKGRKACSYPSFESHLEGAQVCQDAVTVSGHVITSRGMGTAVDFGLKLTEVLLGAEKAGEIAAQIVYRQV